MSQISAESAAMKIRDFFKNIDNFAHEFGSWNALADSEFVQVTDNGDNNSNNSNTSNNSNNNNSNNTQNEWISETKETLTALNYESGMIGDNEFQEEYKHF
jgi:hypothetical protein